MAFFGIVFSNFGGFGNGDGRQVDSLDPLETSVQKLRTLQESSEAKNENHKKNNSFSSALGIQVESDGLLHHFKALKRSNQMFETPKIPPGRQIDSLDPLEAHTIASDLTQRVPGRAFRASEPSWRP